MIAAHEGGESYVCDLTAPLRPTQLTISHHPKILVGAGIFIWGQAGRLGLLRAGVLGLDARWLRC